MAFDFLDTLPSFFSSDPKKDELVVKDVYHEDVLTQETTHTEEESVMLNTITEYFTSKTPTPQEITTTVNDSISSDHNGLGFTSDGIKKQVEQAFGGGGSSDGLSNRQKNDIGNMLNDLSGTKGSKVVFKDVTKLIEGGTDGLTASNLIGTINRIAKQGDVFKLLDLEAEAAYILGLSKTIIDWGVPELIDSIIQKIDDAKLRNQMLEELAIRSARKGDLNQARYFSTEMGHGRAKAIQKELISLLCSRFKTGTHETRSDKALGEELIAFFTWLNPDWDWAYTAHGKMRNLEYYSQLNQRAVKVLSYTDRAKYALTGHTRSIDKPMTTAGRLFPQILEWRLN